MSLESMFGSEMVKKDGTAVSTSEALAGKDVIGVYFSAHWCPPCRGFTPVLAETYKTIVAAGKNFEIVFVSFDREEGACKEYFAEMPWIMLPFDSDKKEALSEQFGVSGIPALILLNADGSLKTKEGRQVVTGDAKGEKYPWA